MRTRFAKLAGTLLLICGFGAEDAVAQTPGEARLEATLLDYNGSGTKHYTVVWVTTDSGLFIKSLRKQGPSSWTSKEWGNHCQSWNNARAGSTVLDGYTSATASSYTGTNSPVISTWNCRDAANNLVPDGRYKFWVQYAENSGQGPYTTSGLAWTKGSESATNTYPAQGANFANLRVTWTPSAPPAVPPTITSVTPTPAGTVGVPYTFTCAASGTAPITFSALGLPNGLEIDPAGVISGIPLAAGTFDGTVTAANGTAPLATQVFSIIIGVVPVTIAQVQTDGVRLMLGGVGPAGGRYVLLTSASASLPTPQWTPLATGAFDGLGRFSFTNLLDPGQPRSFYLLRSP